MASRFAVGIFSLGALFSFTACHRESTVVAGAKGQIFYMGLRDDPADLDPHTNISVSTATVLSSLFDGLVDLGNDGRTIIPASAERWEISGDGKTYTFHLRPHLQWSNGDPLNSQDFLLSFRRIFDPLLGSEIASQGFSIVGAEDYALGHSHKVEALGLAAPDESTLVITLAHPAPYMLTVLAQQPFYPVHIASVEKFHGLHQRGGTWTKPGNLISNGPFQLKDWVGNQAVIVEKNPHYWDSARVQLKEVHFIPMEDELVEERAFRAGQLDVTFRFPPDKAAAYIAAHSTELKISPILRSDYITFNTTQPPFNDARIRRAFSLAIDREKFVAAVFGPTADNLFSLTRDGTGGYHPPKSSACRFDPTEAKRLLAEAGYKDPATFPSVELMLPGNAGYVVKAGEVLQELLTHNLGVKVTVQPTEFKTYLEAERTKHFHFLFEAWMYGWDDPLDPLQLAKTGNPNNDAGWSNARYDELYKTADNTADPTERKQTFDEMEGILAQEVPFAPIFAMNNARLVSPLVRGWLDNPLNYVVWRSLSMQTAPAN